MCSMRDFNEIIKNTIPYNFTIPCYYCCMFITKAQVESKISLHLSVTSITTSPILVAYVGLFLQARQVLLVPEASVQLYPPEEEKLQQLLQFVDPQEFLSVGHLLDICWTSVEDIPEQ